MRHEALVITNDETIIALIDETMTSIDHGYERVNNQSDARRKLKTKEYSYVLIDLNIPATPKGRVTDRVHGYHLVEEIQEIKGKGTVPVIIMDDQACCLNYVVNYQQQGASDFVAKPVSSRVLAKVIRRVVCNGNGRNGANIIVPTGAPELFRGGELIFHSNRVEICTVDIPVSGLVRKALNELKAKRDSGRYVAHSGDELAKLTKCRRVQNGISEAIRDFRDKSIDLFRSEANVICGRQDIIQSGGPGYRFNEWIWIGGTDGTTKTAGDVTNGTEPNERQLWILDQLNKGVKVQIGTVTSHCNCSVRTAKRDLAELKESGRIEFVGTPRTGHYRLRRQRVRVA